jgi:hypothetical protein
MAGESDLIIQIRQALAQYDHDSLVAIANKGMVRRARKDLQNGDVKGIVGAKTDDSDRVWAKLEVAEYEVEISALGATKAICTCPAIEVCRHILAASMWLSEGATTTSESVNSTANIDDSETLTKKDKNVSIAQENNEVTKKEGDRPAPSSPITDSNQASQQGSQTLPKSSSPAKDQADQTTSPKPCQELLDYDLSQLKKWVGKKDFEAAIALFSNNPSVEISEGSPIIIKLPDFKIECRYFLGAGLEGMVCSRKSPQTNRYLVLAVLAYQKQHGIDHQAIAQQEDLAKANEAISDSTNAQIKLLQQMIQLFAEAVGMGICNLSNAVQQRFTSLSVAATGANLPRLAKVLRGIADEIDLLAKRSAQADEGRLLLELARADAIANATLQTLLAKRIPPISLVGQHRSKYEEVGDLDLTGMGAYHWETKTGYAGVTILFWENELKQWFCWSEVRPTFRGMGFSPWWRYKQSDIWEQSPETLSQNAFKLLSARRNHQNRLSASSQSKVVALSKSEPVKLDFVDRYFKRWKDLRNYAASVVRTGLSEYDLLQEMVIVSPAEWGERDYDEVNQVFSWWLADEDEDYLPLQVWYRPTDEGRIKFLETLEPHKYWVWGIVAQVTIAADGLSLYPISLLCQPPIVESSSQQDSQNDSSEKDKDSQKDAKKKSKKEAEYRTIINLSFANKKYTKFSDSDDSSDRNVSATQELAENDEQDESIDLEITPLDLRVEHLIDNLQRLAEHGGLISEEMQRELKLTEKEFDRVGLSLFADLLNQVNSSAGSDRQLPHLLLKLRYLGRLWQENRLKINLLN